MLSADAGNSWSIEESMATDHSAAAGGGGAKPLDSGFMLRVFYVFAALALISIVISVGGKLLGRSIAAVGHTEDTTLYEIVIGNNVLAVPANMIRFEKGRREGEAYRLDLYLKWPQMTGYTNADRDEFNNRDNRRNIIFLTVEERQMSRDMSGRLEPIYRRLIELPGAPGPANGLRAYQFSEASGYLNEWLIVGDRAGHEAFVARCLTGRAAAESLAGCERDVHVADQLSLTYRFPEAMLQNWRALDAAVLAKMAEFLRVGR
jgi:hypothetical protein